jgi:hypothetical protein
LTSRILAPASTRVAAVIVATFYSEYQRQVEQTM